MTTSETDNQYLAAAGSTIIDERADWHDLVVAGVLAEARGESCDIGIHHLPAAHGSDFYCNYQ